MLDIVIQFCKLVPPCQVSQFTKWQSFFLALYDTQYKFNFLSYLTNAKDNFDDSQAFSVTIQLGPVYVDKINLDPALFTSYVTYYVICWLL